MDTSKVSIAAPPERGILQRSKFHCDGGDAGFQLRPRRSGGFCPMPQRFNPDRPPTVSIAAPPERGILHETEIDNYDPAEVSIAAPPERGILPPRPAHGAAGLRSFNCGPAGAGDFARHGLL